MPCILVKGNVRLRENALPSSLLTDRLFDLLFDPEDGSSNFLSNICNLLPDYMKTIPFKIISVSNVIFNPR
jgi:hypothetical protein